jgi:DNA-binding MarR family transcriptional regulator
MFDVDGVFNGFILPEQGNYAIAMPANWPEVTKAIDNLAELKVVQLVLWTTWGNGQADTLMPLTLDDFAECTGLSKQSVAAGIERAIEHGYIERQIEYYSEDGRVRSMRAYGIKLYQPEINNFVEDQESLLSAELALEADSSENQDVCFSSSREFERYTQNNNTEDTLRIQEDTNNFDAGKEPCPLLSRADNATLCHRVEWFSDNLGDREHTASNIGQTRRILASYQARGGNFEGFLLLMGEARDLARRKTKIRRANRMPYFFACLRTACGSVELAA